MGKVIGVIEFTDLRRWGIIPVDLKEEHPDLDEILNSARDNRIGLELDEDFKKPIRVDNIGMQVPAIYEDIHDRIKWSNDIQYLSERSIEEAIAVIHSHIDSNGESMSMLEKYKELVRADYLQYVARDAKIQENIQILAPDISIVGAAHAYANHKRGNDDVLIEHPLNMKEVEREVSMAYNYSSTEEMLQMHLESIPALRYGLFKPHELPEGVEEHEKDWMAVFGNSRQHDVVKSGSIAKARPDYVGSWSLESNRVPIYGFFEMFVDHRKGDEVSGMISDCYGDAKFEGKFNGLDFTFTKEYTMPLKVRDQFLGEIGNAFPRPMEYRCHKTDGFYSGHFGNSRRFCLFEYKPGVEKKILDCEDGNKLFKESILKFPN